jgi:hypothetical protein
MKKHVALLTTFLTLSGCACNLKEVDLSVLIGTRVTLQGKLFLNTKDPDPIVQIGSEPVWLQSSGQTFPRQKYTEGQLITVEGKLNYFKAEKQEGDVPVQMVPSHYYFTQWRIIEAKGQANQSFQRTQ